MKVGSIINIIGDIVVRIHDLHRNTLFLDWTHELPKEFYSRDAVHLYPFKDTENTLALTIVAGIEK